MTELSVLISIKNHQADCQRRVVEALREQSLPRSEWEIILIDNGSAKLSERTFDISWHPNTRQTSAPQRGIREASGDLLLFLEDNIVLNSTYLAEAIRIGKKWPRMGIWGAGNICLEFEVEPSKDVKDYLTGLYSRTIRTPLWSNFLEMPLWSNFLERDEAIPTVPGLCARASLASAFSRVSNTILTQLRNDLRSFTIDVSDDFIAYNTCKMGMGMGLFPEMKQLRIISRERAQKPYLQKYAVARSYMRYQMMYKCQKIPPLNPRSLRGLQVIATAFKGSLLSRGLRRRLYIAELYHLITANSQI